jgi:hypothetical protein
VGGVLAAAQLAVDREIDHGKLADLAIDLELGPDCPHVLCLKRRLSAAHFSFVQRAFAGGADLDVLWSLHGRTPLQCQYARNNDPTPEEPQFFEIVRKDQNLLGSCIARNERSTTR